MENKADNRLPEELASALRELRWVLRGLQMSGIGCWPRSEAKAAHIEERCEADAVALDASPLEAIRQELGECGRCRLGTGRTLLVFGEGAADSELVFVGEGPGFDEDRQGRPFVGRAGKLLNGMIRALGMAREQVYICNVVKCRPPGNRTPNPDEIEVCSRFLFEQLRTIEPRVICALGACAAQTLLESTAPISRLRGKVHRWRGIPLICTYHPAYLLRNPAQKALAWEDLTRVRHLLQSGGSLP